MEKQPKKQPKPQPKSEPKKRGAFLVLSATAPRPIEGAPTNLSSEAEVKHWMRASGYVGTIHAVRPLRPISSVVEKVVRFV